MAEAAVLKKSFPLVNREATYDTEIEEEIRSTSRDPAATQLALRIADA